MPRHPTAGSSARETGTPNSSHGSLFQNGNREIFQETIWDGVALGHGNVGALWCSRKGAAKCFLVASDPVKKHDPWAVAGLKVATPSGDPVLGN